MPDICHKTFVSLANKAVLQRWYIAEAGLKKEEKIPESI